MRLGGAFGNIHLPGEGVLMSIFIICAKPRKLGEQSESDPQCKCDVRGWGCIRFRRCAEAHRRTPSKFCSGLPAGTVTERFRIGDRAWKRFPWGGSPVCRWTSRQGRCMSRGVDPLSMDASSSRAFSERTRLLMNREIDIPACPGARNPKNRQAPHPDFRHPRFKKMQAP